MKQNREPDPEAILNDRGLQTRIWRRGDATFQDQCDLFRFWQSCRRKPCRRAHACAGDALGCYARRLYALPRQEQAWRDALLRALMIGKPPAEAVHAARAELARGGRAA